MKIRKQVLHSNVKPIYLCESEKFCKAMSDQPYDSKPWTRKRCRETVRSDRDMSFKESDENGLDSQKRTNEDIMNEQRKLIIELRKLQSQPFGCILRK